MRNYTPSNRAVGNRFEDIFAEMLYEQGFWVLRVPQGYSGQPADIVGGKGNAQVLIDCKVCGTRAGFRMDRIEDNQRAAMTLFEERTNGFAAFAFALPTGEVRILNAYEVFGAENDGVKRLSNEDILKHGLSVKEWCSRICLI